MVLWDYIVVGGGLAGCTISNRLLEFNPSLQIVVIEAGGDPRNDDRILFYGNDTEGVGSMYDWNYTTTAQAHANNRTVVLDQGKGLGGGTIINGAAWTRGNEIDYNLWGETVNDARWTYEGWLPYMKKTEHYWNASINPTQHGFDGNVWVQTISSTDRYYPLFPYELQAWAELNVSARPFLDANAGMPNGVGELNENRHDGKRQLSCSVYSQTGITLLTETLVEKVLLEKTENGTNVSWRATGVQLANGTQLHARGETIISAGAIRTPQLLLLSGIGPADELAAAGIETKVDLPDVGQNFADHTISYYTWKVKNPDDGWAVGSDNPVFDEPQFALGLPYDLLASKSEGTLEGLAAAIEVDEGVVPDPDTHPVLRQFENRTFFEHTIDFAGSTDGSAVIAVGVQFLITSRGSIRLASTDPKDQPLIDPNYLGTEVDRYVMREAIRTQIALLSGNTTVLGREIFDGEEPAAGFSLPLSSPNVTDAYIDARARAAAGSCYHPMGTAAMGKVVDTDLRVKGVANLRVVDASVFPVVIPAHTQVGVYALAEQAAVIIAQQSQGLSISST